MVDYKGPKLMGISLPATIISSYDESVPFENLTMTSSSEVIF